MGRRSSIVLLAEGAKDVNGNPVTSAEVKEALDSAGRYFGYFQLEFFKLKIQLEGLTPCASRCSENGTDFRF